MQLITTNNNNEGNNANAKPDVLKLNAEKKMVVEMQASREMVNAMKEE